MANVGKLELEPVPDPQLPPHQLPCCLAVLCSLPICPDAVKEHCHILTSIPIIKQAPPKPFFLSANVWFACPVLVVDEILGFQELSHLHNMKYEVSHSCTHLLEGYQAPPA